MTCLMCLSDNVAKHFKRHDPRYGPRTYWVCAACGLVFLDPSQRLNAVDEKARYDTHQNDPTDEGYVGFIKRLAIPLSERLLPGARGLDYGCGPGPTMSVILGEKGFQIDNYDPFYFPNESLLKNTYDFISCSEVVEHFYNPRQEFAQFAKLLKPGGTLGVMTEFNKNLDDFGEWWYQRDPTHVCFYSVKTFDWIAQWQGWLRAYPQKNVVIFQSTH